MTDAFKSTREDPAIACAVVTGAGGKAFSAGGDFYAMMRLNRANAYMWNDRMLGLAMTIRGLPIPVIAMINGWCMGGGHEWALWCDLAIASDRAVLGQTGAKVGACPTVGATQYLPRIIGERLAREMIFLGRRFPADEAERIGLINKCVPHEDLLTETLKWCETIKGHSSQMLRYTKVMDLSAGIEWPKWCVDGTTNLVLNCPDRHHGRHFVAARKSGTHEGGARSSFAIRGERAYGRRP